MKRIFTFLLAILVAPFFAISQDLVIADFEDGSDAGFGTWNGTKEVIANPFKSGINTSDYVLKYEPTAAWGGISLWSDDGVVAGNYVTLKVDVYTESENVNIQLSLISSDSGQDFSKIRSTVKDEWVTLEFDISELEVRDYKQFAFQNTENVIYYFDNIVLIEGELSEVITSEIKLNDFEDGEVDGWGSWKATADISVINNPFKDEENGSDKVLKIDTDGEWGSLTKWFGDAGITSKSPKEIQIMIYAEADGQLKLHMDNPLDTDDENIEMYKPIEGNKWNLVKFDVSDLNSLGYKQLAFQPENDGIYYIDNIVIVIKEEEEEGVGIKNNLYNNAIFTTNGSIVVKSDKTSKIEIYNISGNKVYETISSDITVTVDSGLYIVVINNNAQKILVK